MSNELFRVDYPTGHMEVFVGRFFGESPVDKIKKFLRLAAANCSSEQREELIEDIKREDKSLEASLAKLSDIESRFIEAAIEAVGHPVFMAPSPVINELKRKRIKLVKSLELVKEVWKE